MQNLVPWNLIINWSIENLNIAKISTVFVSQCGHDFIEYISIVLEIKKSLPNKMADCDRLWVVSMWHSKKKSWDMKESASSLRQRRRERGVMEKMNVVETQKDFNQRS